MLRIQNIRLPYGHSETQLLNAAAAALRVDPAEIRELKILRKSFDCRRKPQIDLVYTLQVCCTREKQIRSHLKRYRNVSVLEETVFRLEVCGTQTLLERPYIIGAGPAGLFCALELARAGYCPVIAERGRPVEERTADVERFRKGGTLDPESNIQFGEGGAGAFSDGKLSTGVKDRDGRCRKVLQELVHFGADPQILTDAKPHVGTDVLVRILMNIRSEITALGGTFRFSLRLDQICEGPGQTLRLFFSDGSTALTQAVVLAPGNGAADTFRMLYGSGVPMEQKAFAVGFRIEHPQELINRYAYGPQPKDAGLPPASYKLTAQTGGRGVYSFCMCPGGYVIAASSDPDGTVVNGMSYHDRNGSNANSAIVMTVNGADFGSDDVLSALDYRQRLERKTYALCGGAVPQQRLGDFSAARKTVSEGGIRSQIRGNHAFSDLSGLLTSQMNEAFLSAMEKFDRQIPGFADPDAILSAAETRTSSPVRILRTETGESAFAGIYPCGEGAGYAGGICSAAMDGLKTAQALARRFRPIAAGI